MADSSPKRKKTRYPALSKGLNLRSRKDYIEPDYTNGVFNEHGEKVIRELTEKEKQYLNDFYAETIITDFLHDPRLKRLLSKKQELINDETVHMLNKQIKEQDPRDKDRIRELKQIVKLTKKQNKDLHKEKIDEIEKQMQEVRDEVLLYPNKEQHKKFYNDNNSRNSCIYTKATSMNKMNQIDPNDHHIFSNIVHSLFGNIDCEDYEEHLIDILEREMYEDEEERLEYVIKEEKSKKKA